MTDTITLPQQRPLDVADRRLLENTIKAARTAAELAAHDTLARLGVGEAKLPDHLNEGQRHLRRRLRALARSLGDQLPATGPQVLTHLPGVVAYEHWHRMLFARFLAENGMLLWEPGVPVTLTECDELARDASINMGARSGWDLAGRLAARMLPQIFKPRSPVFELTFAPEHQLALEKLLAGLPASVFQASDSLGWVYQFWQAQRKEAINKSEVKIGADELPAVTQLFTEPYMVDFLLHNSLGAWWTTRFPAKPCPVPLPYLRLKEDGSPAAGTFAGWPDELSGFRLLDPCCGSGHFLVAAFELLVPMRMAAEGLRAADAVDAVLGQNLHGLELDPRCVEIAVFALALRAWTMLDERGNPLGVRPEMPAPRVVCCGLSVTARPEDWESLVPATHDSTGVKRAGLRRLHETFSQAPLLGSLLDPVRNRQGNLYAADYDSLREVVQSALAAEASAAGEDADEAWGAAVSALGLMDAASLLEQRYQLVVTNVPYLSRGKQSEPLRDYCATQYPQAKNDLANVFLERCLELAVPDTGVAQLVMPQNWLFLGSYKQQRQTLLKTATWNLLALLGPKGFQTPMWDFNVLLITQTRSPAPEAFEMAGLDASAPRTAAEKAVVLRDGEVVRVGQKGQLENPDARVVFDRLSDLPLLSDISDYGKGSTTGDSPRFLLYQCEFPSLNFNCVKWLNSPNCSHMWSGRSQVCKVPINSRVLNDQLGCWIRGGNLYGKNGVAVNKMGSLEPIFFNGEVFDDNICPVCPINETLISAFWSYVSSATFSSNVRAVDKALKVTAGTVTKVPFDLEHWTRVAAERYPHGLPAPYSDDPTQWLFHGHPCGSVVWEEAQTAPDGTLTGGVLREGPPRDDAKVLQVAVARLLGYRWPAEQDPEMELSAESRAWVARCEALAGHADDDGILCLPAVRGEKPAHERLLALLIDAYETVTPGSWKPALLDKMLADADYAGKGLAIWLRDGFFEQHCKVFQHRPFIWHVWDGQKDGFSALVNYHKLDGRNLERLIHTYLGDWIRQQEAGVAGGIDGAQQRLAAAVDLKRRLELIQGGEAPYDVFVRWRPLAEQPIGWNPDINDGVRLNIRPFVTAGVLRHFKKPKLNIHWEKDRGKDVPTAPWYGVFQGDRINDHHLTLAEKRGAREGGEGHLP